MMVAKRANQTTKNTLIIPRNVLNIFVVVVTFCSIVQILIGADITVVILAYLGVLTGSYGLLLLKRGTLTSIYVFTFMFGSIGFAVLLKTIYLQPIDEYLNQPLIMFFLQDVVLIEILIIGIIVDQVGLGRPLLNNNLKMLRPNMINMTAWVFFGLGAAGILTGLSSYSAQNQSGSGALNFLNGFVYLGISCAVYSSIQKNNSQVKLNLTILFMVSMSTVFGLLNDSKFDAFLPVFTFMLSTAFLRGKISKTKIIGGMIVLIFVIKAFTPIIHIARGAGIEHEALSDRISTMAGLIYQSFFSDQSNVVTQQFTSDAGAYYNYFGPKSSGFTSLVLQRFTAVVQSDPVIDAALNKGTIGYSIIQFSFFEILPSFIVKKTLLAATGYAILRQYGIVGFTAGLHPTVPLLGCEYAMGGLLAVILLTFPIVFAVFLYFKKLGGSVQSNVFGIFWFIEMGSYCYSMDFGQFIGLIFRQVPLLLVIILMYETILSKFFLRGSIKLVA